MELGLTAGVVALGVVHGVLPDHGWPIAAAYALEQPRKWVSGTIAALVLGVGHLVSSVVLVAAYFWFAAFAAFAEGPFIKPLAGGLLVCLGVYEYWTRHDGHGHGTGGADDTHDGSHHDHTDGHDGGHHARSHDEDSHGHTDDRDHHDEGHHDHAAAGFLASVRSRLPGGGHRHLDERDAEKGLRTLGTTALVLGFAHEEPIQILAICAGTDRCLELMLVYSLAVIAAILAPTLLLVAGYRSHRERVERYTPYLPTVTAAVLVAVGLAFVFGLI